jgi:hypothetical protein
VSSRLPAVPLAAARAVRRLAVAAAVAAAVIALYLVRDGTPDGGGEWLAVLLAIALVSWPAVVLLMLAAALRALGELPDKLRAAPADARERAVALRGLAEGLRGAGILRLPFRLLRLAWLLLSSRELLAPHAGVLPLVSVPFLLLAAAAAAASGVVIVLAVAAAVALAS